MHDLTEVETAADALPVQEKQQLVRFLLSRLREEHVDIADTPPLSRSLLDIKPVSVGAILQPLRSDEDLLSEMLEDRR